LSVGAEAKASGMARAQAAATEEVAKAAGMKVHKLADLDADQVQGLRARPRIDFTSIFDTVCVAFIMFLA